MIQAHEFRIGNYFIRKHNNGGRITRIDEDALVLMFSNESHWSIKDFEPIPLTPEILIACGLNKVYESEYHTTFDADNLRHPEIGVTIYHKDNRIKFRYLSETNSRCEYLHQLQNLFFVLTGTELTINLENVKV